MKTYNFPFIALALGIMLMPVILKGSEIASDGETALPLLTLLIVCEFSFFVTAIGTFVGIKRILSKGLKPAYAAATLFCALLSIRYMFLGIDLWPL